MTSSFFSDVAILVASVAGWAVFMAALVVLHQLDLRGARWSSAAGWLATGASGAWLGGVPVLLHQAPPWPVVVLAISLAFVTWTNLGLLIQQARKPETVSPRQHQPERAEPGDTEGASHA